MIRICCKLFQGEQTMVWYVEQKVMAGHRVIVERKCVPEGTAKYVIFRNNDFCVISIWIYTSTGYVVFSIGHQYSIVNEK